MPKLFAIAAKLFPTLKVALVAITGVLVNKFSRNRCETSSGAR